LRLAAATILVTRSFPKNGAYWPETLLMLSKRFWLGADCSISGTCPQFSGIDAVRSDTSPLPKHQSA